MEDLDCWSYNDLRIFIVIFKNLVSSAENRESFRSEIILEVIKETHSNCDVG